MSTRLEKQICVVTGGLSGIGEAIARRFVDEGATVIAADISSKKGVLGLAPSTSLRVDVQDPASVDYMIREVLTSYGRLDCIVNAAGIGYDLPFLETSIEIFDRILSVNLRGSFIVGQAAGRAMSSTGGGSILNVASVSGLVGNAGRSAYAASKGGVVALSRAMAVDLAPLEIRVNVLAPGPVDTPLVENMHSKEARRHWTDHTPMHRYGSPEELAGAAVFLCSDDASFVTGHVLVVDGGFLASGVTAPESGDEAVSHQCVKRHRIQKLGAN